MLRRLRELSSDELQACVDAVRTRADAGEFDAGLEAAKPLIAAMRGQRAAAEALVDLVDRRAFTREQGQSLLERAFDAYADDPEIAGAIGGALEDVHDVDFLNAAPPDAPIFVQVAQRLRDHAEATIGRDAEPAALSGLATAARLLGRSWDETAERAFRRLLTLEPDRWRRHYGIGLFFKTRGRFAEGQAANQRAAELGGADNEAVQWNLGICATGAGDAATALRIWKAMGQKLEIGRFDLPDGKYGDVKVRLAERPIAARDPRSVPDDPGCEETIWIERLSPCHGIVRSALYRELGVDFGDAVLFDGAPLAYQTYGDQEIPVFPHLATLARGRYHIFEFAGTQGAAREIAGLSDALPADAVLYVHSEQMLSLCPACAARGAFDHAEHRPAEHHVVVGKLCAPPELSAAELLQALDAAAAAQPSIHLYVPELASAAGQHERAAVEQRRIAMIRDSA